MRFSIESVILSGDGSGSWQDEPSSNVTHTKRRKNYSQSNLPHLPYCPHSLDPLHPLPRLYLALAHKPPLSRQPFGTNPKPSLYSSVLGLGTSVHEKSSLFIITTSVKTAIDSLIILLPFGLLLKWSDGTRLEILAMQACYVAGLSMPRIITYASPETPHTSVPMLMTRFPERGSIR